jgi:hypothetical protein
MLKFVLTHRAVHIHIACAFPQRSAADCLRISLVHRLQRFGLPAHCLRYDRRRWYRSSDLCRGLFLGMPLVPDVSQQRAVTDQMAGHTAKVPPLSIVRLVASLSKRLVSYLLADGQSESVPEGPL